MSKYKAMVFIAKYCGEIVELGTDDLIKHKNTEFMPIISGGFMDQETEFGGYAETYFAVDMGGSWENYSDAILSTEAYNATIDEVGPAISDNIIKILSYLVSKKTIKMIPFTNFDEYITFPHRYN